MKTLLQLDLTSHFTAAVLAIAVTLTAAGALRADDRAQAQPYQQTLAAVTGHAQHA